MKGWIILAMSLIINSLTPPAIAKGIFNPSTMTLPNGLQVVLVQNHIAPIVSVNLIYKVGCADDPLGIHGISHFLEHMMFKGTKDIPADQFKKIIARNGGRINAFTTPDLTGYTCDIAVEFLDSYLKLEADRMQNLLMEEKEVEDEKKVVLEERLMRLDNNPFGVSYESLLRSIFWYHPYGIPAIGYPQHINAYNKENALEHYKKWYAPNNAILIVAGDISFEKLKGMVEKHFGPIPSRPIPERHRITEPDHKGVVISLDQENPRVSQVHINWNYAAPAHHGPHSEYYYPLIVLSQVLGGNEISRLHRNLVDERRIAVNASCSFETDNLNPEAFTFSATLAPNASLNVLKGAIERYIQEVIEKGITDTELVEAKRDILAGLAFARDGNSSSVMTFTRLAVGFTVDQVEDWPKKINAVTAAQVHDAAKFVLTQNPVAIMTIYPKGYKEKLKKDQEDDTLKNESKAKEKMKDNASGKSIPVNAKINTSPKD